MPDDFERLYEANLKPAIARGERRELVGRIEPGEEFHHAAAGACVVACSRLMAQRRGNAEDSDFDLGYWILCLLPLWPKSQQEVVWLKRFRRSFLPLVAEYPVARLQFRSMLQPLLLHSTTAEIGAFRARLPLSFFLTLPRDWIRFRSFLQ